MKRVLLLLFIVASCARPIDRMPPPSMARSTVSFPTIEKRPLIVLDPGHGGTDDGTRSRGKKPYLEKDLTLYTTQRVQTCLENMGYQVVITRNSDFFVPLHTRAQYANDIHPALFVSIHYNAAPSIDAQGVEVYYFESKEQAKRSTESKILAKSVLDAVLERTKANRRGVRHGNFHVIRETTMPAILIEGGFMTNDEEMRRLNNPAYIQSLSEGIAAGIHAFHAKAVR